MHSPRMLMHKRAMILHGCSTEFQITTIFSQVFAQRNLFSLKYSLFPNYLLILRRVFSHDVFPIFLILLRNNLFHLYCMGDFFPSFQGPSCPKLGIRGGVRIN